MKGLLFCLLLLPFSAQAKFLFNYGLNYSSEKDSSSVNQYDKSRIFHKILLAAAVNGNKTVFFGWGIDSWTSKLNRGSGNSDTYSMLEMGPKIQWYFSDTYNWYMSAEWNPYAKGTRKKGATSQSDITGSSTGFGLGYRFKVSRLFGLGASIQYHSTALAKETVGSTQSNISDTVTHIMPMLEFSMITK